ncbi:conserved hypothetical protein [Magnetococcus marinus MC-1]|uniref:Uncharacterized protein n=1 Tax=Magnetococcus marinus (strain ATCC BAA-1437 / JCM 17883 / MC-1) TaxID=156889 RepID=A0L6Y1_MAGMM|nr:hypothetical protein [Magnetococcus marinus]ABK43724.1 conserved hypothetical protein [Magnetococcus marinus MC-1]
MLLETYEKNELLMTTNVYGKTADGENMAFRGDLVLIEGEYHELSGKKLAAKAVLGQAVMLADATKIKLVSGCLRMVEQLPIFVEKYGKDLGAECTPIFFVLNLRGEYMVELEGKKYVLLGQERAMVWNELMDLFYLEKGDFKGLSAEDKMITMYDGAKDYKPKANLMPFTEVKSHICEIAEAGGAI